MKRVLIFSLLISLLGCQGQGPAGDVPVYPKARYIRSEQSSGVTEVDGVMVHVAAYEVWEHIDPVGEFYNQKLTGGSWQGQHEKNADLAFYNNGNITLEKTLDNAKPKNPKKPARAVMLAKGEGRTFITIFWSDPAQTPKP
jgi:uncharacterized protein (DUF779 family)